MAIKTFTATEMEELRSNPYTFKVTERNIQFTADFKEKFWELRQQGISFRNIIIQLGYDSEILGDGRIQGIALHIKEQALSGEGFYSGRKQKALTSDYDDLSPSRALIKMQSEISYLKQELEFIKKIIVADKETRLKK